MRLTRSFALIAMLGTCGLAYGQAFNQQIDSVRAPFSTTATYSLTVQMESVNPTTGKFVLVGTAFKIATFNLLTDTVVLADLIGPKTAAVPPVIASIRATFTTSGGTGWTAEPFVTHVAIKEPFTMPLASFLGCRYDMPAQGVLMTPGPGNLRCAVGLKAAGLPAPGPVAVGTVPPVVVLPPPPPGIAPVGSTAIPGQTLLTAQGSWSFDLVNMGSAGNVLLLNGTPAGGSGVKLVITAAGLKVTNLVGDWYLWTGSGWVATTAP